MRFAGILSTHLLITNDVIFICCYSAKDGGGPIWIQI